MAFGLEVGVIQKFFLTTFTFIAAIGLFYYLYKSQKRDFPLRLGLALILAGALGNLIDRAFYGIIFNYAPLLYGRVVDFIQVEFWDFTLFGNTYETWPIFNIADSAVTIGVAIILLFHKDNAPIEDEKQAELSNEISLAEENNNINNVS